MTDARGSENVTPLRTEIPRIYVGCDTFVARRKSKVLACMVVGSTTH